MALLKAGLIALSRDNQGITLGKLKTTLVSKIRRSGGCEVNLVRVDGLEKCNYLLAFVGSSTLWDWGQNLAVIPLGTITVDPTGLNPSLPIVKVTGHGGFIRLFNTYNIGGQGPVAWYDYLISQGLTQDDIFTKLLVTGNSLGGAHGQIFLWMMKAYYGSIGFVGHSFLTGVPNVFLPVKDYQLLVTAPIAIGQSFVVEGANPTLTNGGLLFTTPVKGAIVDGVSQIPPGFTKCGRRFLYQLNGKLGKGNTWLQWGIGAVAAVSKVGTLALDAMLPGSGQVAKAVIGVTEQIAKSQTLQYEIHVTTSYQTLNEVDLSAAENYIYGMELSGGVLFNVSIGDVQRDVKRVRNKWHLSCVMEVEGKVLEYPWEPLFVDNAPNFADDWFRSAGASCVRECDVEYLKRRIWYGNDQSAFDMHEYNDMPPLMNETDTAQSQESKDMCVDKTSHDESRSVKNCVACGGMLAELLPKQN